MRLAFAVLLALALAAPAEAQRRTIYSSLPSTGQGAEQARAMERGMRMAFLEAADSTLAYVTLDSARSGSEGWHPGQVSANARQAVSDATSVAYLGEAHSPATMFSLPILNEAGILQISPSNAYVGLTRDGAGSGAGDPDRYYPSGLRTFGRVVPADHVQARALIDYARVRGRRRVVILHDGGLYGAGVARMLRESAPDGGVRVVGRAHVRRNNAGAIARFVRSRRPAAVIFCGGTSFDAVPLWRAVHRRNRRIELFACAGVAGPAFAARVGRGAAARSFMTSAALPESAYPQAGQDFHENFRREYETQPDPFAVYGYEAMALAIDSLRRGDGTREGTIDAFFRTRDRQSVLGKYSIDAFGDTTLRRVGGYRVRRGGPVFDRVLLAP